MFDLARLSLSEGEIPKRPASLLPSTDDGGQSNDVQTENLMMAGKVFVVGGLSVLGEAGYQTRMIGIYQASNLDDPAGADLKGWGLILGNEEFLGESYGFHYVDTTRLSLVELALPSMMTFFISEGTPSLVEESADQEELLAVCRYVLYRMAHIEDV